MAKRKGSALDNLRPWCLQDTLTIWWSHSPLWFLQKGEIINVLSAWINIIPLRFFRVYKKDGWRQIYYGESVAGVCSVRWTQDFPCSELCMQWLPNQLPLPSNLSLPPLYLLNFKWGLWLPHTFKGIACWLAKWPRCVFFQALWRQRTDGVWRIHETAFWIHQQPDEKSI